MKKTSTPKIDPTKTKTKQTSVRSQSKKNQLLDNEEFIDDDYHSYTSSEEQDSMKKIEEYEYNEVCTAYSLLVEKQKASTFENLLMHKLNNIEHTMEKFKKDLAQTTKKAELDQLQKHHASERNKMENVKKYLEEELTYRHKPQYREILEIIANSIKNLNNEFEHKRRRILRRSESKILALIDDIYHISDSSAKEIKQLCNETTINISKRLFGAVGTPSNLNLSLTHHCDDMLEKMQETFNESHECFNYENICKLLSDKLQVTKDELEALEEDNLDITLKYHDTQQAVSEF